ncbi:MAG: glycosyltransferase family 4 protein [Candidatus Nanoarchaeia archaeon]|nr:glycosyltransferase family 4 protein [Candidatus Nanoarchaeia archaeon]MDD5053851.1 glycosyltransferase family 4 protein [Candidatus Nanoarchaeia archaeon]MDD5499594.1 glycosyltransferase family 4 protein [Candidatus Nanoarchaeia archaeon]
MKKINFVSRNYFLDSPGGAEKVFYEIIKRAKKDFDCRIISSYSDNSVFPKNSSIFKRLKTKNKILNYFYYMKNMSLKSVFNCDLIHATNIECLRLTKKPFILTIHHVGHFIYESVRHQNWINKLMAKLVVWQANKASILTTISNNTKKDLVKMGVTAKIVVIPGGINLNEFKPIKNKKNKKFIISNISRISPEKGQDFTIKCFDKLPDKIKDKCELRIIGHISDKNYYDSLKKSGIKYFTNLSNSEYSKKIAESDLVVFPTFMSEGFGLIILESMACGVPVIASDQPAIREAGGNVCQYFEQGNETEFIEKIVKLHKNKAFCKKLSINGIKWVKNFSWDAVYEKYKKLYLKLLK